MSRPYQFLRVLADHGIAVEDRKDAGLVLVPLSMMVASQCEDVVKFARRERDHIQQEILQFKQEQPPVAVAQ